MLTTLWAAATSAVAFLAHVIIWRVARPLNSATALANVFLATLAIGLLCGALLAPESLRPRGWADYAGIVLLYFSLMAAYINTYPAIEVDSPTLHLLHALSSAGASGLSRDEVHALIGGDRAIKPRIRDLLSEHHVTLVGEKMVLSAKGKMIARIFYAYRRVIGRGLGG